MPARVRQSSALGLLSGGQLLCLTYPVLSFDPPLEAQALVDPGNVVGGEPRNLMEVVDAKPVQGLLDAWADAADLLQIVRLALGRGESLRRAPLDILGRRACGRLRRWRYRCPWRRISCP